MPSMTSTTTVASSDGVALAVHTLGDPAPDARPLLLCHATGFHGRVWEALAAELADRRCVALDFRGYGDSTEPDGDLDWHGFADDVLAVVDGLALAEHGPVQAVGHSKGGAALLLAEQARPGTFGAVVAFEPIVFPPPPAGAPAGPNPLAEITRRRRTTFDSVEDAVANYRTKATLGALRPDVLEDYVRHGFAPTDDGRIALKADVEHEARTYEMAAGHGGFARLGEVACPVLVCASGDGGHPAQAAPQVAEALPAGELRRFDDLAHFGPLEDPARFAAVVRDFLGRHG